MMRRLAVILTLVSGVTSSILLRKLLPTEGGCMYNGVPFNQNQTWNDGCGLVCVCENATTGYYRCNDRCPKYPNVSRYCTMETDPSDLCCMRPKCKGKVLTDAPTQRPTFFPIRTQGPDYTYPPNMVPTQYPSYKPFPPGIQSTKSPYLTPGPGYTYPPGRLPTQYPGQTYSPGKEPTLSPYKPFPPDLRPTASPYLTPGPGYTYPPGKVPTQYPGQTFPPGKEPTLSPYKPFPPGLQPTMSPYLTPGPRYTYPPGRLATQYPGQTYPPGKQITLSPYKPFPPNLRPTMSPYLTYVTPGPSYPMLPPRMEAILSPYKLFPPDLRPTTLSYLTPGPGYAYPPGKVPTQYPGQTFPPGKEPTLSPYKPFPPGLQPTICSFYLTPGPGYTYPPGRVPTQYPGQTFPPGKEPTLSPYKPFPPDLRPTMSPYLTPGPGYTYPPGKVPPTNYPGEIPTLSPYKPFPPDLLPTQPYLTPGPGYTYPPGKVPPTSFPGEIPSLSPYKPFPPDLRPTTLSSLTPGPGYAYPPGKVPTQYPGQTFPPGKEPTLSPYKPFPPGLQPTMRSYLTPRPVYHTIRVQTRYPGQTNPPGKVLTLSPFKIFQAGPQRIIPGPGYTFPPGKVPPTRYPGEIPTLSPFKPFPPGLEPTLSPYLTPGPGYTYPLGKAPTQYPGQTFAPGKALTLPPWQPFPPGLGPTLSPYLTPGPGYTYPPGKVPPTTYPGEIPTLSPYRLFPSDLRPTNSPFWTPGPGYTYPPGKVPPTTFPGEIPTLSPYKPFPPDLLPTFSPYLTTYPQPAFHPISTPYFNFPAKPFSPDLKPGPTNDPTKKQSIPTAILGIVTDKGVGVNENKCVYIDGTLHNNGSKWFDGCDYTCECVDPAMNFYNCTARCKVFSNLPSICTLKPDPADACCEQPDCGTYSPIIGNTITGTPPPNKLNIIPIGTHTVFFGSSKNPTQSSETRDACIYKGKIYKQGQSWDDGCDYTCSCENGQKGLYRCLSKCPAYPVLPQYCQRKMVPGQCCSVIKCDIPGFGTLNPDSQLIPTPARTSGMNVVTTPAPTRLAPIVQILPKVNPQNITSGYFPGGGYPIKTSQISFIRTQCVYRNKVYSQGESWEIDCDFTCSCVEGLTGYYECNPRCPQYFNLPKECFTQQEQGKCCKSVLCVNPEGKFVKPNKQFPVVGTFHGGFNGFRPGLNYTTDSRSGCIYKGTHYDVGKEWYDGCDFHCKCMDDVTGRYECNAICPTYSKLPALCHLNDIQGSCCNRLECSRPTTVAPNMPTPTASVSTPDPNPGCTDVLDNCAVYGPSACKAPYDGWARRNCQHYCGMCAQVGVTTPLCEDKLKNCEQFGKESCVNEFVPWAKENCPSYCQLCPSELTGPTMPPCVDQDPGLCDALGADICTIDPLTAKEHCAARCGLCPKPTGPSYQAKTPTPNGYLLLMKGVTGIQTYPPGVTDLFGLWNSTHTINQLQPGADSLTPNFPGHYKPDLSNHWPDLCLDKVKVSIYKNGAEKAFILFNATGADKMNWFSPNRIIDSSWIDLNSAQTQYFNMAKDPDFLREFYASQSKGGKCDSTGWMMVSTANHCFLESDKKPAFYYAPGQSSAHWGLTNPGVGDVFTIQGHTTCPTRISTPAPIKQNSTGCYYKGSVYKQGQSWQDGCDFNCTCDDEKSGHYRCLPLCPVYDHLLSGCRILKTDGNCCGHVSCRMCFDCGPILTHPPNTCFYKGQYYGQNDTWIDDCKYKCSCENAALGFYRCKELCVNWNLPPWCTLDDPKPGKCCKTPNCPQLINPSYPEGYIEE